MLFKNISLLDENFQLVENTDLLTEGAFIKKIGRDIHCPGEEVKDGKNKLLMSGFYNTHMHIPMSLMRGYGENLPLDRWLNDKIFPFEDRLCDDYAYSASVLQIAEMIKYGTVSVSDMYFFCGAIAKACAESGIYANLSRCVTCFDDSDLKNLASFNEEKSLREEYDGFDNGRILIDTSLHAEYTCSEKIVRQMSEYSEGIGSRMQIHLSETQKEQEECIKRHGKTPAEFFADCGAFDVPVTAAHCVWVTDSDIKLLAAKNVSVAHCPVSNLKLGSGIAPVKKMLDGGVNVALGTDGVASNNNADISEELKLAAILHKGAALDPTAVSAAQALKLATVNGAAAQGRADCGVIKEGDRANLIMLDLNAPNLNPIHSAVNNIVYSLTPDNIRMTMAGGRILYENGEYKTIDIEKAVYEVNACKNKILASL